MEKGRISKRDERERDKVEEVLFSLCRSKNDLKEVDLRIRQSRIRSSVVEDVLEPADELIISITKNLDKVINIVHRDWLDGQKRKWK